MIKIEKKELQKVEPKMF